MMQRWEVGSEFDWSNEFVSSSGSDSLWPQSYELFATGMASLLSLKQKIESPQDRRVRLHLPSFFCMEAAAKLAKEFDIGWYKDVPTQRQPDFDSLKADANDLVLAVNLFGIRTQKVWIDWQQQRRDITLIEDHSHDPFSAWARRSTADYAMASLRKTLPIPDGAIMWSPQNHELPTSSRIESNGASKRLTAMLLKRAYLSGGAVSKEAYRQLEIESQDDLDDVSKDTISAFSAGILKSLDVADFRRRRADNIRHFIALWLCDRHPDWTPLVTEWDTGCVPFNSVIVCRNQDIRDRLRKHLISQNIFPAIHWRQPHEGVSSDDPEAIALASKILTIASDQRYSLSDITRVFKRIQSFFQASDRSQKQYAYAQRMSQ
ncbi:MAG: hypothetical protein WBC73_22930 [Phormidesmis sp.]